MAAGALALLAGSFAPSLSPPGLLEVHFGILATCALVAAAAGLHRPFGGSGLGLGTLVLPFAILRLGAIPASLLGALAVLAIELVHRALGRAHPQPRRERRRILRAFESAGGAAVACFAGSATWVLMTPESSPLGVDGRLVDVTAAVAAVYLLVSGGLRALAHFLYRSTQRVEPVALFLPLSLDLGGWVVGATVAATATRAGDPLAIVLLIVLGAFCLEAFRNARLSHQSRRRARELEEVTRASQRVGASGDELVELAERVRAECTKLVPSRWFQLEIYEEGGAPHSWAAGPDGVLFEGSARPEKSPPALPGIHRRPSWRLLEHALEENGRALGKLRLWCDPRTAEEQGVALLAALVPQLSASVHRALLDRASKRDPLTGILVRRVLERRLEDAFERCREHGSSMAVLMCDLDHFKRINDTYGHLVGDQALISVARVLEARTKPSDLCCRFGGEEFLVLVEGCDGATALAVADRLRCDVESLAFEVDGRRVPLTLSIGVAAYPDLYVAASAELPLLADAALYEAKRRGRNLCLLDLGRGRFRAPSGQIFTNPERPTQIDPPRLFA